MLIIVTLTPLSLQTPGNTNLLCISMYSPVLDIPYKWNHIVYIFCDGLHFTHDVMFSSFFHHFYCQIISYFWKEKGSDVQLYANSWSSANGLAGWSGRWKNIIWKSMTRKLEGFHVLILWMGKKTWSYLCPLWMLIKEWPQQGNILIK